MKKNWKTFLLVWTLLFSISCVSLPSFAEPVSGGNNSAPVQTDPNTLPEAGAPVTPPSTPPASSSKAPAVSSSKPPASSKPSTRTSSSRRSVSKPAQSGASSGTSSLESALSSIPSGSLPESSSMPEIILPTVSVESGNDGQLVDSKNIPVVNNRKTNWIGIAAWICIGVGVLVVLLVVLSNRRPPRGGNGRKRYRRPRRAKRRLLNDRYYRHIKY